MKNRLKDEVKEKGRKNVKTGLYKLEETLTF